MARLLIISGRSGSGKSAVLHVLEDIGFSCIDNLPFALLPRLVDHINSIKDNKQFAISIDARNSSADLRQFPTIIRSPIMDGIDCQVLFIDASDTVLLQRFSETRRKHPLSNDNIDLNEAIRLERRLLGPITNVADLVLDTSKLGLYDLRNLIKQRIMSGQVPGIAILFQSFGFKHGIAQDADLVFDVRCLPNPHWKTELRALSGKDKPVMEFLNAQPEVKRMIDDIGQFLTHWFPQYEASNRSYITVAIGCTGGQHRSVYICEQLYKHFKLSFTNVQVRHRELAPTITQEP
jgi:RNase adapter protein RapZ